MSRLAVALLTASALLLPQAEGGIQGTVRTSNGDRPLAYARVLVVGDSVSDWTDDRGGYRLGGLRRGEWRLRVTHPGHDSLELDVSVPGDRVVRLDITLQAHPGPAVDALADFEPFRVEYTLPALLNGEAVAGLMRRLYPPALTRDRRGGEAVLRLWLDERGQVVRSLISSSSGQPALDSIALTVSDSMRFRPARSGPDGVRVIVRMPIVFTVPALEEGDGGAGSGGGERAPSGAGGV
jgi:TonB family protein